MFVKKQSFLKEVSYYITYKCNLRCHYCYLPENFFLRKGEKPVEDIIQELKRKGTKRIDILGGEPFLEKGKFIKIVGLAKKEGIKIDSVSTNGLILDNGIVQYLRKLKGITVQISLDAANPKTYKLVRNSSRFRKVIENVDYLLKQEIRTILSFVVTKKNWQELKMFIKLAKKLKVDGISLSGFIPIGRGKKVKNWMLGLKELFPIYKLANSEMKEIDIFGINEKGCPAGIEKIALLPNGDIYPCGLFISFPETKIGNIFDKKINEKSLKQFINIEIPKKCESCCLPSLCPGGCKAFLYSKLRKIENSIGFHK